MDSDWIRYSFSAIAHSDTMWFGIQTTNAKNRKCKFAQCKFRQKCSEDGISAAEYVTEI